MQSTLPPAGFLQWPLYGSMSLHLGKAQGAGPEGVGCWGGFHERLRSFGDPGGKSSRELLLAKLLASAQQGMRE